MIKKEDILVLGDLKDATSSEMINIIRKSRYFKIKILILPNNNLSLDNKCRKKFINTKIFFNGKPHNSKIIMNNIKEFKINLGISTGFKTRLRSSFLSLFKKKIINFHPSVLPHNKGAHSTFWSIINNSKLGATMHYMNDKYDSGDILDQKILNHDKIILADELFITSRAYCIELLKKNLKNIYNKKLKPKKNLKGYYNNNKKIIQKVNLSSFKSIRISKLWDLLRAVHYKDNGLIINIKNKKFKIIPKIVPL